MLNKYLCKSNSKICLIYKNKFINFTTFNNKSKSIFSKKKKFLNPEFNETNTIDISENEKTSNPEENTRYYFNN